MKKLALFLLWFPVVNVCLIFSLLFLKSYSQTKASNTLLKIKAQQMLVKNEYQFFAALPEVLGSFTSAIKVQDARPEILRNFLHQHQSPFENHFSTIISESDKYQIDFRLITAIGMCESNLGKKMPANSYNAWGYAIYTGEESGAKFANWEEAIKIMANYLSETYYIQGLTTPEEIGPIYAPPSIENGNSWAKCVRGFMDQLI